MTPKEKALELVDKCMRYHRNGIYNVVNKDIAKQYAIIAVDELISEYQSMSDTDSIIYIENEITYVIHKLVYWQEVKQEIELL